MRRPVRKRLPAANGDDDPDRLYGARKATPRSWTRTHPTGRIPARNVKTKVRPRDSRPYVAIMNVRATTATRHNEVPTWPPCSRM